MAHRRLAGRAEVQRRLRAQRADQDARRRARRALRHQAAAAGVLEGLLRAPGEPRARRSTRARPPPAHWYDLPIGTHPRPHLPQRASSWVAAASSAGSTSRPRSPTLIFEKLDAERETIDAELGLPEDVDWDPIPESSPAASACTGRPTSPTAPPGPSSSRGWDARGEVQDGVRRSCSGLGPAGQRWRYSRRVCTGRNR